jgi:cation:H+ antiporter
VITVVGADLLVGGAATAARSLGVSDAIVGLTIVAIDTSAPEFVTTLLSTLRGDRDIALGNLSVYNLALILGLTIVLAPTVVAVPAEVLEGDLVLMATGAIACVPVFLTGRRINRVGAACSSPRTVATSRGCCWSAPNHLLRANLAAGTATRGGRRR